ncbi:MAG: hypothetical protein WBC63_01385 [Candidatus Bipolaricaulia bacterium]
MSRTLVRRVAIVISVLLLGGWTAAASDLGFSGMVGLEVTYTPIPPASFNIGAELSLGFDVSGFSFTSETGFDLFGFQSEKVKLAVDLGAVQISEEIRFEPTFSWNELSVDLGIVGVQFGIDWILANIGSVQTPDYSMGTVIELSSGIVWGFSITSLTGFGAVGLVNLLDGVEAPFSHQFLSLFQYLDTLCVPPIELDVTIVDGFYFEEELVRLEVDYLGMIASSTTWFDFQGLSKVLFELGYRFDEPSLGFLTSMTIDGSFAISGLGFIVDLQIDVVRFTSHTAFVEAIAPGPIPIVFGGQSFAVSFEIVGVVITSGTYFDGSFLFAEETIAIDAVIDPVGFRSVTTFDAGGFAGQSVCAAVSFSGVVLFTRAEFDATGIQLVSFGFELRF